jgi:hypothetical protein
MKWLFTLLLLLCVGFFAFARWGGESATGDFSLQAQAELNADKIKLLPVAASEPAPSAPSIAATVPPAVCMEWGEFFGDEAKRASAALAAFKLGNALTQRQTEHIAGFWVYLAPSKTLADAEKKIAQLKTLGVNDYFVVRDSGQWRYAVSLGIFHTQQAAADYQKALEAKGVQAIQIGERPGKRTYTVFTLKNLDTALTEKITELSRQYPNSELKPVPCGD